MKRAAAMVLCLALIAFGALLLGQGAWIQAKAHLAQVLLHRAWDQARTGAARPAPWPWADTWPVGRLKAERLSVDQLILAQASGRNLAFGPTLIAPSALPGQPGHSILSGHRDTHFGFLEDLKSGDRLQVEGIGQVADYEVTGAGVIDLRREQLMLAPEDDRLTLVTCFPFDAVAAGTPYRYVVNARRLPRRRPTVL